MRDLLERRRRKRIMGERELFLILVLMTFHGWKSCALMEAKPRQILLDTDMDTDDIFALIYLLKQNRSQFDLKV